MASVFFLQRGRSGYHKPEMFLGMYLSRTAKEPVLSPLYFISLFIYVLPNIPGCLERAVIIEQYMDRTTLPPDRLCKIHCEEEEEEDDFVLFSGNNACYSSDERSHLKNLVAGIFAAVAG